MDQLKYDLVDEFGSLSIPDSFEQTLKEKAEKTTVLAAFQFLTPRDERHQKLHEAVRHCASVLPDAISVENLMEFLLEVKAKEKTFQEFFFTIKNLLREEEKMNVFEQVIQSIRIISIRITSIFKSFDSNHFDSQSSEME